MSYSQQILLASYGLLRLLARAGVVIEEAELREFHRRVEMWAAKAQVEGREGLTPKVASQKR